MSQGGAIRPNPNPAVAAALLDAQTRTLAAKAKKIAESREEVEKEKRALEEQRLRDGEFDAITGTLDGDDLEEAQVTAENFAQYVPRKLKIGIPHPDMLIESQSLASVEMPPITYKLVIPQNVIDAGKLSAPQLETVVYASQMHEGPRLPGTKERAGFFLGDGAGVGKGRQLSGLIFENWLQGRKKAIWLSASADLHIDARRDLDDVSGRNKIPHFCLNKLPYTAIDEPHGLMFTTYSSLIASSKTTTYKNSEGKKVNMTRLQQLIDWVGGENFHGCILFDECHKAKNLQPTGGLKPTKCGLAVEELQKKLPNARIVYCSATGVTEPANMAYMTRLGLWGPGTPFPVGFSADAGFLKSMEKGGVGMMELVAMHLKKAGNYLCRTLSFKGCTFKIDEEAVSKEATDLYDAAALLWQDIYRELKEKLEGPKVAEFLALFPRKKAAKGGDDYEEIEDDDESQNQDEVPVVVPEDDSKASGVLLRYYWGSHQRFFRGMCISLKVPRAIEISKEAVKNGNSVVIGLQSTGEAGLNSELVGQGSDAGVGLDQISAPATTLKRTIYRLLPLPNKIKQMESIEWDIRETQNLIAENRSIISKLRSRTIRQSSTEKRKSTEIHPFFKKQVAAEEKRGRKRLVPHARSRKGSDDGWNSDEETAGNKSVEIIDLTMDDCSVENRPNNKLDSSDEDCKKRKLSGGKIAVRKSRRSVIASDDEDEEEHQKMASVDSKEKEEDDIMNVSLKTASLHPILCCTYLPSRHD